MSRDEEDKETGQWILDSGASVHCTSDSNLLHDYILMHEPYKLCTANGAVLMAVGRGTLKTERYKIPDVLVVPGLQNNIISAAKLVGEHELSIFYKVGHYSVNDRTGQEVGRGHLTRNRLWMLDYLIIGKDTSDASLPTKVLQESSQAKKAKADELDSAQSSMQMHGNVWVLDCCAWRHYTSNVLLLDGIDAPPSSRDDDDQIPLRGSIRMEKIEVPDVRYVQGGARNVISVAQLARSHGLVTVFEPTTAYVRDAATEEEVGRACLDDGVYVLDYLRISQPLDVVDASLGPHKAPFVSSGMGHSMPGIVPALFNFVKHWSGWERFQRNRMGPKGIDESHGDVSKLKLESPEKESWFGMSRSDSAMELNVVDVFPMSSSPYGQQGGSTRSKEFYMDSGTCQHMTWNGHVLKAYHETLQIKPPIESVTRAINSGSSRPLNVEGIGYIDSEGGSLDSVLFVPDSTANLVSVSQLTKDQYARVVFHRDVFWIEKIQTKERIGHGQWVGFNYVVVDLDVGAGSVWVLDTFAWHHHTPNRKMLCAFQETLQDVHSTGAHELSILGHGLVRNVRFKVPGVRYIPGDAKNVVSVAQLADDHDLITVFQPKSCYVKQNETGQIVGKGRLLKGTYVLDYLRIDLQQNIIEEMDDQEDGSRRGGSESIGHEEKDEEEGTGDGRRGGGEHGEESGGTGFGEGTEKGKSEGAKGGDRSEGENQDEDKDKEGGRGDRGDENKDNDKDGNGKEEDKVVDIFALSRFVRIPGPDERHSCRLYHHNRTEVCARAAPAMPLPNNQCQRHFFMDSGACFHVTWDSSIINRYSEDLGIMLPTKSISGFYGSDDIAVEYSGYIDTDATTLDGVLFVPDTAMNLVSVSQLSDQYNVNLVMGRCGFSIYKDGNLSLAIGQGRRQGQHYILDSFRPGYRYVENPNIWHYRRQHNSHSGTASTVHALSFTSVNPNPDNILLEGPNRAVTDGMIVKILPSVTTLGVVGVGNIQINRIQLENAMYVPELNIVSVPVGSLKKQLCTEVRDRLLNEEHDLRSKANAGAPDWWIEHFALPLQRMGVLSLLVDELARQFVRLQLNVQQQPQQIQHLASQIKAMSMPLPQEWINHVVYNFQQRISDGLTQLQDKGWLLLRSGAVSSHLQGMGMPDDLAQLLVQKLGDPHMKAAGEFARHLEELHVPQPLILQLAHQLIAAPNSKPVESWIDDIVCQISCDFCEVLPLHSTFQITLGKSVVLGGGRIDVHSVYYLDHLRPCPRVRLSLWPDVLSNSYKWALAEVHQ